MRRSGAASLEIPGLESRGESAVQDLISGIEANAIAVINSEVCGLQLQV
jgi:hypothetical protein